MPADQTRVPTPQSLTAWGMSCALEGIFDQSSCVTRPSSQARAIELPSISTTSQAVLPVSTMVLILASSPLYSPATTLVPALFSKGP
ncbi:hypothetical protein D3C79_995920 [compost metagenome]